MARTQYLVDTSVLARLTKPVVSAAFAPLAVEGRVAMCSPVAFELGFSARNSEDCRAVTDRLQAFPTVAVTDADLRRALEVQASLCDRGQHRAVSFVDGLVAAVAEAHGLTVLHYDADFELVAAVTGQKQEWIVQPGAAE
ncbi:MAG TPA: PIN domain nuclease [Acidimicrobiales bacterium]